MFRRVMTTVGAALLIAALTACDSREPERSAPATSPQTSVPAQQPSPEATRLSRIKEGAVVRIGVLSNAAPFSAENTSNNEFEGFDVDMARYVAQKLAGDGAKVQFQGVTKATRVPMIQGGEIDLLLATLTITEERKQVVDFSRPYYPSPTGVMVLDDSPIQTVRDLKGKTNCNPQGSAAWDFFRMALAEDESTREIAQDLKVTQLPSPTDCLLALRQKRGVDFVASDYATLVGQADQAAGLRLLKEQFGEKLNSFGVAIAKGQPDLLDAVNAAVCQSFEDGSWTKIYSKWFKGQPPAGWPQKC